MRCQQPPQRLRGQKGCISYEHEQQRGSLLQFTAPCEQRMSSAALFLLLDEFDVAVGGGAK